MHFPALFHSHKTHEQEIDFVIGRNFLITTRYDTVDPLHKFSKLFEVNSILGKSEIGEHAGFLFFYMLKNLYHAVEHEVEYVRHNLRAVEEPDSSGNLFVIPWWYRTEFTVVEGGRETRTLLRINGIVASADVWLNGTLIAPAADVAGAYPVHEFDVTRWVRAGTNTLALRVHPGYESAFRGERP